MSLCGNRLNVFVLYCCCFLFIYALAWNPHGLLKILRLTLYSINTHFDASTTAFENIVGKGEIAGYQQFLLFPQCFQLNLIIVSPFVNIFDLISLFAAELEEPKIGISSKGLNFYFGKSKLIRIQQFLKTWLETEKMLITSISNAVF